MATVEQLEQQADSMGIDREAIEGTGADGNVVKADLEKAIEAARNAQQGEDSADQGKSPWDTPADTNADADSADKDVPSEARDQVTPTGKHPEEINEEAAELTSDNLADRIQAEAKDQVTPSGVDLPKVQEAAIKAMEGEADEDEDFSDLSDEERDEVGREMDEAVKAAVSRVRSRREARKMEARMIDGNRHYGNATVRKTPKDSDTSED